MKAKIVYVSGPITGMPDNNKTAFDSACEHWRDKGWVALNPLNYKGENEKFIMIKEISDLILKADAIYMLSGWENSLGAQIEHLFARKFDIPIHYQS